METTRLGIKTRETRLEFMGVPARRVLLAAYVLSALMAGLGGAIIALSTRHKAGIAVRFPRILRKRDDKTIDDADSLDTLKGLLAAAVCA